MSAKKDNAAIVAVGVAACAVCCAGPILGVLAAIGLGTAAGYLLVGTVAVAVGIIGAIILFATRRRTRRTKTSAVESVPVTLTVAGAAPDDHARTARG